MTVAGEVVLAHQALLHALPFVVPALIVVALIGFLVWRDRREQDEESP